MADAATLVFDVDSSQALGAAKALAVMEKAAASAELGAAKLTKQTKKANGEFISFGDIAKQNSTEIRRLADQFNPLLSAQLRAADAEVQLADAVRLGVVSKAQAAAELSRLTSQYNAAATAQRTFGQSSEVAGHHVANLGYQLNDIGMMMSLGQNPFALMMQQGPQVAQIFAQMNAEGRKIGPTIAGAFTMMLNPTTLVTLGLIGGAAALLQWARGGDDASKSAANFADRLSDLDKRFEDIGRDFTFNIDTGKLEANVDQIIQKYGSLNNEVRTHISLLEQATQMAAGYASIDLMAAFSETFGNGWLTTQIDEVRIAFDTTNDEARRLIYMMEEIENARGITAQRQAAEALRDEIYRITGGIQNMDAEQTQFALQINQTVDSLRRAEVQLNRNTAEIQNAVIQTAQWERAMSGVLGYVNSVGNALSRIGGGAISFAANAVELKMLQEGKSLQESALAASRERARLESQEIVGGLKIQNKWLRSAAEFAVNAAAQAKISQEEQLAGEREIAREREKAATAGGGGGGGGASAKAAAAEIKQAENKFQSLRELLEKETIFNFAEYEKRQAQLDMALKKKLITEQNHELMRQQLRTFYFGSEYEQKQLQYQMDHDALVSALDRELITRQEYAARMRQMQWQQVSELGEIRDSGWAYELNQMASAFGQMNQLAGGNYDKLLKAQRAFAAASALISTMQGAAKALELPFPMNIAAAGKVIAAGMGFIGAIKSGSSSGSGGGGGAAANPAPATTQEPVQNVLVNLSGDQWLVDMAGEVIDQIAEQSRNGRVIIQRDRN